ncbi:hypothetical protein DV711_18105 [Motiliproteus coralliicola]|uniref:Haemolysin-type calcium binding-related domain-containing protein n=1 Tax=Motiliproteus coralliicola TaxID=2283196 RepID=A0A369W7Q3_9GAMM|nr:hypothetical protein DV711_18105 [Motiliproteus coralliicola]
MEEYFDQFLDGYLKNTVERIDSIDQYIISNIDPVYNRGSERKFIPTACRIHEFTSTGFNDAQSWTAPPPRRRDPLTLDLDGDGIETLATDGSVLFDHDGDGIKHATGWVASDDGLLVLDRNGNGTIDNGAELFGDSTLLADGSTAEHGFAALADLDQNGDGVVDAADGQFADLKVWRDLNSDGISQADELLTLAEAGVQSLSVQSSSNNVNYGDGNTSQLSGSFTRTDGTTGHMADLDLASNLFHREFTDTVAIPEELEGSPDMRGSGAVRDLRQAAALSPALAAILSQYAAAGSKTEQEALLDNLLIEWANSADFDTLSERLEEWNTSNPGDQRAYTGDYATGQATTMLDKLQVLEVFNNNEFGNAQTIVATDGSSTLSGAQHDLLDQAYSSLRQSVYDALLMQTRLKPYVDSIGLQVLDGELALDFGEMEGVFSSELSGAPENAVANLLELNQVTDNSLDQSNWNLNTFLADQLRTASALTPAVQALLEEHSIAILLEDTTDHTLSQAGIVVGNAMDNSISAIVGNNELYGGEGNDSITTSGGSNLLDGGAGDDTLIAQSGTVADDILRGGDGNDYLKVSHGDDILDGGAGDDLLLTSRTNASLKRNYHVRWIGGEGNDRLEGYASSDTYVFNRGDGQDVINDHNGGYSATDVIEFGEGITREHISVVRDGSHLVLQISDPDGIANDQITLENALSDSAYQIELLNFADGSSLTNAELMEIVSVWHGSDADDVMEGSNQRDVLYGEGGNDTLTDNAGNNELYGGEGNDSITTSGGSNLLDGGAGDDTLIAQSGTVADDILRGGDGNDYLKVSHGDDILDGGAGDDLLLTSRTNASLKRNYHVRWIGGEGNDRLEGYASSDTYVFNRGDGQDVINDHNGGYSATDVIEFGGGISSEELWLTRDANDLVIDTIGNSDQIRIENWYSSSSYQIERIETADSVLTNNLVDQLVNAMAEFDVPAGDGAVVPQEAKDQLAPVIASSWQPLV